MIELCCPFYPNKYNAQQIYDEIMDLLRESPDADLINRFMVLIELENIADEKLSDVRAAPCSEDIITDLFSLISNPGSEECYNLFKKNTLASDVISKMVKTPAKYRRQDEFIDVWEVTRMVIFPMSSEAFLKLEKQKKFLGKSFDALIELIPPLKEYKHRHGGVFLYELTDIGHEVFNYQFKVESNISKVIFWLVDHKEVLWEKFQIPWFRPEKPAYDEIHNNLPFYKKGNVQSESLADPIALIPCWAYALKQAGLPETVYDDFRKEGFEYGLTQKTNDIVKFLNQRGFVLKIYKLSKRGDGRVCQTYDRHPKAGCEDWPVLEVDIFDNHVMQHIDFKNLLGFSKISLLSAFQKLLEIGAIRKPNQYEIYNKYNYSKSLDKMLEFNIKEFFKDPTKVDLWVASADLKRDKSVNELFKYGFFDFEATTDGEFHRPYCVSFTIDNKPIQSFFGGKCAKEFIDWIKNYIYENFCNKNGWISKARATHSPILRFYAHNLHYDFQFIADYLRNIDTCEKSNNLYSVKAQIFVNRQCFFIEFWDTYSLFMTSLKNVGKNYLTKEQQISIKKEVFPYSAYNSNNVFCRVSDWMPLIFAKDSFKDDFKYKEFIDILTKFGDYFYDVNNQKFNLVRYAIFYCEQDVRVLQFAFNNFRKLLLGSNELGFSGTCPFSIDCLNHRTASSIGYYYADLNCIGGIMEKEMERSGLKPIEENNVIFKTAGPLRFLILKANRGGRCMVRDNGKFYYNAKDNNGVKLQDYDGVSLYPSAMSRLWISSGKPKLFLCDNEFYNEKTFKNLWLNCDSVDFENENHKWSDCVVHVIHINSKKKLHFPVLCAKDPSSLLNEWRNFNDEDCDLWINGIDLQNFIDFQEGEFNWDCAIYWSNKRLIDIRSCISKLFLFRANNKNHPIQNVTKLMMNSISGKSLLKMAKDEIICVDKIKWIKVNNCWKSVDNYRDWFNANIYRVKDLEDCGSYVRARVYTTDLSYQLPIFGQDVFAMARRIIQPIFNIAEELELEHPEMSPAIYYTDTDSMHIREDILPLVEQKYFEIYQKTLKGSSLGCFHTDFEPINGKTVAGSTEAYFISKKIYCDRLITEDGSEGFHFRMKGIPNDLLEWDHYINLYNNKIQVYDLLDKNHVSFIFKNGKIKSQTSMERKIMTTDARLMLEKESQLLKDLEATLKRSYAFHEGAGQPEKKRKTSF